MDSLGLLWNGLIGALAEALKFFTLELWGNYGLAIIVFTLVIKFIMLPLTVQQIRSSKAMMELQPQLQALQKKYGKDREKLMQEQMALYKENKVNPAAGCLPLLIQMPIWFALYSALRLLAAPATGFEPATHGFLWIPNLALPEGTPWSNPVGLPILAVATGVTQWVVQRMMAPRSSDPQQQMMNQMMQFMPLMFVWFALSVPAGLVLYWVTSNLFQFAQQYFTTGWGSLSMPASLSSLLGIKTTAPGVNGVARRQDALVVNAPSSNGSKAAAGQEEDAIAQAKDQTGSRRKRSKRR